MDFQDNTIPASDVNNAIPTETPASTSAPFVPSSYGQVESTSPISSTVIDSNTPLDLGDTPFKEPEYTETVNPPLVPEPLQTETLNNTFKEPEFTENTIDREAITPEQEKLNIEFASFMKEQFPGAFTGESFGANTIYTASAGDYLDSKAFASFEMGGGELPVSITESNLFKALQTAREYPNEVESTDMKEIIRNLLSYNGAISFSKNGLQFSDGNPIQGKSMLRQESLKGFKREDVDKLFAALKVVNDLALLKLQKEEEERKNIINTVEDLRELLPTTKPSI